MKRKTTVITSTKSVIDGAEKRLLELAKGDKPKNESEVQLKKEIDEIKKKGRFIDIPSN